MGGIFIPPIIYNGRLKCQRKKYITSDTQKWDE